MRLWKNSYAGVPINTGTTSVNQKFLCAGLNPLLNNKYYSTNVTSAFANQSYGMYVFPSDRSKNSAWSCIGVMDTSNTNTRYYILKAIPSPSTYGWIAESYTGKQGGKVFDGMYYVLKLDGLDNVQPMQINPNSTATGTALVHSGAANVLMVDGHVQSLRAGDFANLAARPS